MLAGELRARQLKLEQEQKARSERERQRIEKEKLLQERQRQRLQELEDAQRLRRKAEQEAVELAQKKREDIVENNNGVFLQQALHAVPADEESVAQRGIKRAADKLILPPSAGAELLAQEASKNGAMLFEVASSSGRHTHAGVLEFTAAEGVVAIPRKVANCLWGMGCEPEGDVTVTYRRLPKGTYVRLQPESRTFHEDLGMDMKAVLEDTLHKYSALTELDWLQVEHHGTVYNLRVLELKPETAVSIIDTDIEADVGPSMETEEAIKEAQAALEREAARLEAAAAEREALAAAAVAAAARHAAEQAGLAAAAAAARERVRMSAEAALLPEPPAGHPGPICTCMFRLPDGSRISRRFPLDTHVQQLFDFVDSKGAGGWERGGYALVTQFPRRRVTPGTAGTLGEAGLAAGQEAFLLEKHQQEAEDMQQ